MDLFKTILLCLLVVALQGCNGCHNTRTEEAGKHYQNRTEQDSIRKELQKMEDSREEINVPEILQGDWVLTSIDSMDSHTPKVLAKSIGFKSDSIFIFYKGKQFIGTWKYDSSSLNISIKGTNQFDYAFAGFNNGILCLQLKKPKILECFGKLDFSKATY